MVRLTFSLLGFGVLSYVAVQAARSIFGMRDTYPIYGVTEEDIVADLPGAKLHLETPAA